MGVSTKVPFIYVLISFSAHLNFIASSPGSLVPRSVVQAVAHDEGSVIVRTDSAFLDEDEEIFKVDLMSWLHGHISSIGNVSDADVKSIVNSLKQFSRPESSKYPRVKVYNYQFDDEGNAEEKGFTREVLVYTDPDQRKQWIVEIEELDLRQNLIIFRSGDMGFGFAKENTFFVLRKTMSRDDIYHYFHIAYIMPNRRGRGQKDARDVEWDTIRPKDLLPVPLIYKEPRGVHENHCKATDCEIADFIFGTCVIKRLSCEDVKDLKINGKDKERMDALIREQQPFIMEVAKGTSVDVRFMNQDDKGPEIEAERRKRMLDPVGHHSVKKDNAFADLRSYGIGLGVREASGSNSHTEKRPKRVARESKPIDYNAKEPEKFPELGDRSTRNTRPAVQHEVNRSYFEDILDKIRKSPPAQYTVRQMECTGCDPIGPFFTQFEYSPLQLYVANNLVHDVFQNTSPDVVFSPEAEEVMREDKFIPFVGYGRCPYSVKTILHPPKSVELDDLITYYAETFGADCEEADYEHQLVKFRMRELLTSRNHLLEVWPDKTIRINKSSTLPKSQLLSTKEVNQLMVSIVLAVYTTEYQLLIINRIDHERMELPNRNQSARMRFLTKVVLYTVSELMKVFPQHTVKGLTFLLQMLEDKYLALVAEYSAICEYDFQSSQNETQAYKDMNRHDRLQVMALKDFIVSGSGHLAKGEGVLPAFTTYYNHNYERISNLIVEFGVDRRKSSKKKKDKNKDKDQGKDEADGKGKDAVKRTAPVDDYYDDDLLQKVLGWGPENSPNMDKPLLKIMQESSGK